MAGTQVLQGQTLEQNKYNQHEFSFQVSGGMSPLTFKTEVGESSGGGGFGAGFGYTYRFNPNWGISTGVNVATFGNKLSLDAFNGSYNTTDNQGDDFRFSYSVTNYEEKQNVTMVLIPIMARYELPLNFNFAETDLQVAGGFKVGLPLSSKSTVQQGTFSSQGYYSHENQTYQNLPHRGFVTNHTMDKAKNTLELKTAIMLSLEAGLSFNLGNDLALFSGLYFDYGLNDIQKLQDGELVQYQSENPAALQTGNALQTNMVSKIVPMSVGLKVRIGLNR